MSKKAYREIYIGENANMWVRWGVWCEEHGTTRSREIRKLMHNQLPVILIAAAVGLSVWMYLQKSADIILTAPCAYSEVDC